MSQYEFENEAFEFSGEETEYGELNEYGEVNEFRELYELESPLNELTEMELASELLEVTNEQELEEFLGGLFRNVARAAGGLLRSPVGQSLGGILKTVAKQALPAVGGALGSMVAPGIGTVLGSRLGGMAGNLFELELEGLEMEQAEFEVARRYVQLAATAARNAALAPPNRPADAVAEQAVASAAQRYAPGLARMAAGNGGQGRSYAAAAPGYGGYAQPEESASGRWVRRGRKIVLYGA